ncbi:hypothetical protein MASR2M36_37930 [Providencia sp.]
MAQATPIHATNRSSINWGKWLLIAIGILFSVLLLIIPIIWIFITAFKKA